MAPPQKDLQVEEIQYDGLPVKDWLISRVLPFLAMNPVVRGRHRLEFSFTGPVLFTMSADKAVARKISIEFSITGAWIVQQVEIDASSGFYDWLYGSVRLGGSAGRLLYKNVQFGTGGRKISCPPEIARNTGSGLTRNVQIGLVDVGGLPLPDQYPRLDHLVLESDLQPIKTNLDPDSMISSR